MTLRTKSKAQQWTVWLCASLALLTVYVVVTRALYGSVGFDVFVPRHHRLMIPLVAMLAYIVKETRWDGIRRSNRREKGDAGKAKVKTEGQDEVEKSGGGEQRDLTNSVALTRPVAASAEETAPCQPQPQPQPQSQPPTATSSLTGEELFEQARALPHQVVPSFDSDGPYLELLGKSAEMGFAPALVKLGEYAMRRAAWVEAYYWMKQAQRNGMRGLTPTLREIRKNWMLDGFPEQSSNVNWLFTEEAGSIGRALLHLDSGHEAAKARMYLKAAHPEYLSGVSHLNERAQHPVA